MVICNKCGTEDVDNFTYCSLCGAQLDIFPVNKYDKGMKLSKKIQLLLAIGIGLVIVLIANL